MSYFDDELEKDLSNSNITFEKLKPEVHDSFVSSINKKFPFSGSKITWNTLPNSMNYVKKEANQAFIDISKRITTLNASEIIFIGDSLTDKAYKISTANLECALAIFADIPQHTYFFSESLSFIGCISSEGEIDFSESSS
ncbi:hypothetical protein QZR14_12530 [Pseudomonas sp. rhizo66]|uniref:hypothetical protein n=1 Tax=Pseudomonas sp. rhizo66 TaxID=3059674 RepID=UPI002890375F|nr:hypothetical protein [Pseudomonas sp. rhizo66]MDT3312180.1 hypothetical protein [Pseudomonas sp. rhizo66]